MVMKLGKLLGSLGQSTLVRLGRSTGGKQSDPAVVDAEDVRITEITSLEEMVNERTRDLAEAREQLRQLSSTAYNSAEGKDEARVKGALADLLKSKGGSDLLAAKVSPEANGGVKAEGALMPPFQPPKELVVQTVKASTETTDGLQLNSAPAEEPLATSKLPEGMKAQLVGSQTIEALPTSKPAGGAKAQVALNIISATEEKKTTSAEAGEMISKIFNKEEGESNPLANLMASLPDASVRELLDEALELKAMLVEWQQN